MKKRTVLLIGIQAVIFVWLVAPGLLSLLPIIETNFYFRRDWSYRQTLFVIRFLWWVEAATLSYCVILWIKDKTKGEKIPLIATVACINFAVVSLTLYVIQR